MAWVVLEEIEIMSRKSPFWPDHFSSTKTCKVTALSWASSNSQYINALMRERKMGNGQSVLSLPQESGGEGGGGISRILDARRKYCRPLWEFVGDLQVATCIFDFEATQAQWKAPRQPCATSCHRARIKRLEPQL